MFQDSLTKATNSLLSAVSAVTDAMNEKKEIILRAETAIKETQQAINSAKKTLSL